MQDLIFFNCGIKYTVCTSSTTGDLLLSIGMVQWMEILSYNVFLLWLYSSVNNVLLNREKVNYRA